MQFYININQRVLSAIGNVEDGKDKKKKNKLDFFDAAILSYIIRICKSDSDRLVRVVLKGEENNPFTWVDYKTLCQEMPLLKINSSSPIQKRTTRLCEFGFIEKTLYKETMPCFRLTRKVGLVDLNSLPDFFKSTCEGCKENCKDCEDYDEIVKYNQKGY